MNGDYLKFFKRKSLNDVFTPSSYAKLTYVEREEQEMLLSAINQPGKQIIVYGHSGVGKSTLVYNTLRQNRLRSIITQCDSETTMDDLMEAISMKLNIFSISQRKLRKSQHISSKQSISSGFLKSKAGSGISNTVESTESPIVDFKVTKQVIAENLGKEEKIWVIEDFHKVSLENRKAIGDLLKVFCDMSNQFINLKVICIGAVNSANELFSLNRDLKKGRVAQIGVEYLNDSQIREIMHVGFKRLNVDVNEEEIDRIVFCSNRIASVTHSICRQMCLIKGIKTSSLLRRSISKDAFDEAILHFVKENRDSYEGLIEEIISKRTDGWYILKAISSIQKSEFHLSEVPSIVDGYSLSQSKINSFVSLLVELDFEEFDELLKSRNGPHMIVISPFFKSFLKLIMPENLEAEKERLEKIKRRKNGQKLIRIGYSPIDEPEFADDYIEMLSMDFSKNQHDEANKLIRYRAGGF